jgi:hypothetical protein
VYTYRLTIDKNLLLMWKLTSADGTYTCVYLHSIYTMCEELNITFGSGWLCVLFFGKHTFCERQIEIRNNTVNTRCCTTPALTPSFFGIQYI